MYANTPNSALYRVAELRRREDHSFAAEQRRHKLVSPPSDRLGKVKNRLGGLLIATGARMIADPPSGTQQVTTG